MFGIIFRHVVVFDPEKMNLLVGLAIAILIVVVAGVLVCAMKK